MERDISSTYKLFMVRCQDAEECAIVMLEIRRYDRAYHSAEYVYNDLIREVQRVFKIQGVDYHGKYTPADDIIKLEARWLSCWMIQKDIHILL